tara:strand:- start:1611 stop:7277 length:5667 start_codon:yes stop_codon:yes gene_type:complete
MARDNGSKAQQKDIRIAELLTTLRDTERELLALTGEEIEPTNLEGNPADLSRATAQLPPAGSVQPVAAAELIGILNALPAHIALLDNNAVILTVNDAWQRFASANTLETRDFFIGQNYISVCESAHGECADEAVAVANGIRSVLNGEQEMFSLEYPCHSPDEQRWFRLMVTPYTQMKNNGAVVMHVNVTDRRQAEEALRTREQEQRLLAKRLRIETTRLHESQMVGNVGSWETDFATQKVIWTPETFRIFEVSPDSFVPTHPKFLQLIHPDDREAVDRAFTDSFKHPGQFSIEHRMCPSGGTIKYIEERWQTFNDDDGVPVRAVGTCQDITGRKVAEQNVQARSRQQSVIAELGLTATSATRLQDVFDSTVKAVAGGLGVELSKILQITPHGTALRLVSGMGWNPGVIGTATVESDLTSQAGYTLKEDKTVVVEDMRTESRFPAPALLVEHGVVSGISVPIKFLGKPWGVLGAHTRTARQFNADDCRFVESVATLLSVMIDRLTFQRNLSESELRMRNAQRIANLGNWELDISSQTLRWSEEIYRMFGLTPGEPQVTYEELLSLIHSDDKERVQAAIQAAIDGTMHSSEIVQFDHRILRPDGEIRYVNQRAEVINDDQGNPATLSGVMLDDTEQTRAKTEREHIFSLSQDLISIASFDGHLLQVNPAWTRCLGWDIEKIISHPALYFVHPDDHDATMRVAERLARGEQISHFENRFRCQDGSYRTLSWNAQPLPEDRQIFSIARDVTESRLSSELLRENEERFRLMVEGSEQVLYYTYDRDHRFTYLSPSTASVVGFTPEELLGRHHDELIIADDPANGHVPVMAGQAMRDGKPVDAYSAAVRHASGHRILLEIMESPTIRNGEIVGIQGFARDITERERAQSNLLLSERRFRGLFEQAAVGMVLFSEQGHFLRVNERFTQMIGYSREDLLKRGRDDVTHPSDRELEIKYANQILAGDIESASWEKRYLRADGNAIWCNLTLSLLPATDQESRHLIGIIEDITERREALEALRQNQNLLRIAGDVAKIGGWTIDLPTQTLTWSEEVFSIHDLPAGDTPDFESAINFYREEDRDTVKHCVEQCMYAGKPYHFELELVTANNRHVWVRSSGEAVRDAENNIVRVQGALQDISSLKEAEASLVESQHRFRLMADTFPFIIWTSDIDGQVTYSNRRFIEYTGVDPDAPPATRWQPCVHPEDLPGCMELWLECVRNNRPYETQYRLRRADGMYRWHRVQSSPVQDATGQVISWYGTGLDIHDSKLLEQESTRLATQLNDTLESITDGFFILDREWRFSFANAHAEMMLSRSRGDMIGNAIWDVFPSFFGSSFHENYTRARQENVAVHFEGYIPPPLNRWYEVNAYPSDGGLAVYFRDISDVRASTAQLRLLETAVSRLNDIVLITEAEPINAPGPRIVFVNEAFERRTGYSRSEVVGKTPRILQGKKTQRAELDRIRHALEQWQPVRAELLNYTKAGEEFWLELDIVPLADSSGKYTHWVSIERDITERHKFEEQLRESQRLESVGQLTGGVAHDFNNLLTVIIGNTELLQEQLVAPDSRALADMVLKAGLRGADLTKRLLAFARRQALDPRVVDINALIMGMEPLLRRTLGEHIQLMVYYDESLWLAFVDPAQLENALLNLCLNSRDAMRGGGSLMIETKNVYIESDYANGKLDLSPGAYTSLAVTDTGTGMDENTLGRVFEPFFTTKEKGKGTGLGLAMIYGFVKQSGGHITVYSEAGEGTTVKLYLPRNDGENLSPDQAEQDNEIRGGSETILLVEDDEFVRNYALMLLVGLGYRVLVANNGMQALEVLQSSAADDVELLFTDVVMPGMSGRELAEQAVELIPQLKVLYTSGYTENAIVHHGRLDPGVQLLAKPFRRSELARKIRHLLDE